MRGNNLGAGKANNFIPSSNLSQFLLKKGSSGSLHTFENNEYSYKINLESINTANAGKGQGAGAHQSNNQNHVASSDMGQYDPDHARELGG